MHAEHLKMKYLTTLDEFHTAIEGDVLVVIDFTATWCGPCRAIAPYYESLGAIYPDVVFYKVDVDAAPEISQDQKVRAMPTFGFYRKGEQLGVVIGANKSALDDQLRALA